MREKPKDEGIALIFPAISRICYGFHDMENQNEGMHKQEAHHNQNPMQTDVLELIDCSLVIHCRISVNGQDGEYSSCQIEK